MDRPVTTAKVKKSSGKKTKTVASVSEVPGETPEDSTCKEAEAAVDSHSVVPSVGLGQEQSPDIPAATEKDDRKHMDINLVPSTASRKDKRLVIFNFEDGRAGSVQFLKTLFGDNTPGALTLSGDSLSEAKPKAAPKVKETPAERKARMAMLPKLTPAQKLAKAEEKVAALRKKLEAAQASA